jgi:MarR family transcriptional regulator, organic hydroperoxide resistance regulator
MNPEDSPILKIHKFIFLTEKLLDRELASQYDVSFSQFRVLSVISRNPGISQKKIATIQEMTQAAISRHIDVLERMHYVALATNSMNRKEHNLHLTQRGSELYLSAHGFVSDRSRSLLDALAARQRNDLQAIFDILLGEVRREHDGDSHF